MLKRRVIPTLLWDDRGLCKPISFNRPGRFVGSLMATSKLYESRVCDELVLIDIDATPKKRRPRFEQVKKFTSQLFCPLTIGGGVTELDDFRELLNAGADKIIIKTAASEQLIIKASKKFGAQCVVVALDYTLDDSKPLDSQRKKIARIATEYESWGAGEIILTNMKHDGTRTGYDLPTMRFVCAAVNIPVVANGGCGKPAHMLEAIGAGAHAVAASTMFLYDDVTPAHCKTYLDQHGVPMRIEA